MIGAPTARARFSSTLTTAFWLGWKVESNWTDPLLYVGYSVIRPVAGSLILAFMFIAVTRQTAGPMLEFLIVGTAFWPFVLSGTRGMVMGMLEDREQFQTLRALYSSPVSYRVYLIGRALAQVVSVAIVSAIVTLSIGVIALNLHVSLGVSSIAYALAATVLGAGAVLALGLIATAAVFFLTHEAWNMPEGVAMGLYLLSGAIYPVTILPGWLETIARALPLSWWLEATRRGLTPRAPQQFPAFSDAATLGVLAVLTAAFAVIAWIVFGISETRARRVGGYDERSGY